MAITAGVMGMVVLAAVHRLQQATNHLTQDSITYFLDGALTQLSGGVGDYLAHWNTQTDEWLYNAPLMFSSSNPGDLWFPFYVTQSVSLAAFLCMVYGLVHRVAWRHERLAAMLAVITAFGFTTSIIPWLYAPVIAGGQPAIGLAHPGRLIGILAPWLVLLLAGRVRRLGVPAIALATLGLGFVTLNALLFVGAAVTGTLVWRGLRSRRDVLASPWTRAALHGVVVLAVILPPAAFAYTKAPPKEPMIPVTLLLAAAAALLVAALVLAWGTTKSPGRAVGRRQVQWFLAWVLTAACGVAFSDSLSVGGAGARVHSTLGHLLPGFEGPLLRRNDLQDGPLTGASFPAFSPEACDHNISCGGVSYFLLAYGVLFAMLLSAWVGYGRLRADASAVNQRRVVMLTALAALAAGLIAVYFTGGTNLQASIFTRMIEWPYYTLLLLGVLGLCEARNRVVLFLGTVFLAAWTIAPLVTVRWPGQLVLNVEWYLARFGLS